MATLTLPSPLEGEGKKNGTCRRQPPTFPLHRFGWEDKGEGESFFRSQIYIKNRRFCLFPSLPNAGRLHDMRTHSKSAEKLAILGGAPVTKSLTVTPWPPTNNTTARALVGIYRSLKFSWNG